MERQRKTDLLNPVDIGLFDHLFERRHATFRRGTRLTPERFQQQVFGTQLRPTEISMFKQMLLNREGAIAFDFSESGRVQPEVAPPYQIRTIPHKAWQSPSFRPPKKLENEVFKMINERLQKRTLELCDSQYRNPWFLVPKKD
ncbi:hypothetical protein BU24DRAFT_342014, partial [Aaosphaeria arxii CBS 175.79]